MKWVLQSLVRLWGTQIKWWYYRNESNYSVCSTTFKWCCLSPSGKVFYGSDNVSGMGVVCWWVNRSYKFDLMAFQPFGNHHTSWHIYLHLRKIWATRVSPATLSSQWPSPRHAYPQLLNDNPIIHLVSHDQENISTIIVLRLLQLELCV